MLEGQAQGYNQITTGTWNEFGGQQYAPDPLHATPEQQNAIAAKIPLSRWDPKTLDYLRGQGFKLDPKATLGANIAANQGVTPTVPGTTLNSAPAAVAGGPGAAPGAGASGGAAGSLPGFQPNSPAAKMTSKGLEQLAGKGAGGGGDDQPASVPPMQLPPPMVSGAPMMLGPGGQNSFGQRAAQQMLAQQGFQTQPSLQYGGANAMPSPIGAPSPGGTPIGTATGIPGLPGTTLNSPSQLQMALITGMMSPYDMYMQQQAAGGGGSNYYG